MHIKNSTLNKLSLVPGLGQAIGLGGIVMHSLKFVGHSLQRLALKTQKGYQSTCRYCTKSTDSKKIRSKNIKNLNKIDKEISLTNDVKAVFKNLARATWVGALFFVILDSKKIQQPLSSTKTSTGEVSSEDPKEDPKEVSNEDPKEVSNEESKEDPKEVSNEESKEVSNEDPKEDSKEVSNEDPKEDSKEVSNEDPKEVSNEDPKEVSNEDPKEVSNEDPKEVSNEDPKEVSNEDPKEVSNEDPKEVSNEDPKEVSNEDPKEVPKVEEREKTQEEVEIQEVKENNTEKSGQGLMANMTDAWNKLPGETASDKIFGYFWGITDND